MSLIAFINSPLPNGKTPNIIFSDVYQGTLNNPIISIPNSDGILYLNSSNYYFPVRYTQIKTFDKFAYAAGTKGVYTLSTASVTNITVNKTYTVTIYSGDGTLSGVKIVVVSSGTTTTTLASDINTALNNFNSTVFTNTVATTTVTINESNASTGGLSVIFSDSNATFNTSTANVLPFGTVAQVALYKPSVTTGTYNLYQFGLEINDKNFEGSGTDTKSLAYVQVWVDTGATGYSLADTQLTQFQPGGSYWGSTYSNILALPK